MRKFIFPVFMLLFFSCKKSSTTDGGGQGTGATVTFINPTFIDQRLIITAESDTIYPFPNRVLDIDIAANSTVTKTGIPASKRKLVTFYNCNAQQPINIACTSSIYKNVDYLEGQVYTETLQ
ncbi:MAG: hypothetical protein KBF74_03605 [Ferruginibacter sp.]|nr:hypothetical protein [Ferruginibacter sp.]